MSWLRRVGSWDAETLWEVPEVPDGVLQVCHPDWRGVRSSAVAFGDPVLEASDFAARNEDSPIVCAGWALVRRHPFSKTCKISIGRPVHPERYSDRGSDHLAWRSMTDEVMYEIREMTGQDYVNAYAGKRAETEPTIEAQVGSVADAPEESVDDAAAGEPSDTLVGVA